MVNMQKGSIAKKLAGTTAVYFIANFSTKILSFLLLPLYTGKLSPAQYGSVDMVLTVSQFLIPVVSLTIQNAAFRFLVDTDSFEERKRIISNSLILLFLTSTLTIAITLVLYFLRSNIYILLGGIYIVLSCWSSYMLQIYRGLKHNKMYAVMGVFNAGVHIGLNVVFIAGLNMGSISLLLSPIFGFVLTCTIMLLSFGFYKHISARAFDWKTEKELIKYALPFIPNNLIWWFLSGFTKLHLSNVHGEAVLGIYSVAHKISDLLISLYSIFHLAWTETAYATYNDDGRDKFYSMAYNKIAKSMLSVVMVMVPMTSVLVPVFLNESYLSAIKYMPLLYGMTYINILSTYYGTGFQCAKKTNGVFVSSVLGASTNVMFCLLLIPKLGVWGAIISLSLSNVVLLIANKFLSKKFFNIKPDFRCYWQLIPIAGLIVAFYLGGLTVNVICLAAAIVIAMLTNMDLLKMVLGLLKRGKK